LCQCRKPQIQKKKSVLGADSSQIVLLEAISLRCVRSTLFSLPIRFRVVVVSDLEGRLALVLRSDTTNDIFGLAIGAHQGATLAIAALEEAQQLLPGKS
jgi:hypothetical protein